MNSRAAHRGHVWLVSLVLIGVSCSTSGLRFTADDRVQWVTEDRSTVQVPFTLQWEVSDFEVTGPDGSSDPDRGYFAVFIDQTPQRPNEPLSALAANDISCNVDQGCPDEEWFKDRRIYIVEDATELVIDDLPALSTDEGREYRKITLILLDGRGRRQGETFFQIEVEVDRSGAGDPVT